MGETSQKTAGLMWLELGDDKVTESHASNGFSRNLMKQIYRLFKRTQFKCRPSVLSIAMILFAVR
jgi:hypothetical protein